MRFHARLHPGVVSDPEEPIDLVIHAPARCDDVTIKVWELDVFRDPETGERVDEGTQDDLLLELVGRIEPGDADRSATGWRRFVATSTRVVGQDPRLPRFRLRVPGLEQPLEVPIVSSEGEVEGESYELGLSIEHGGAERYRTQVPCLFTPPRRLPVLVHRQVAGRLEDGAPDPEWTSEGRVSLRHVAFGVADGAPGKGYGQRLRVLARGFVDVHGRVVRAPGDVAEGQAPAPLTLRKDVPLYAWLHDDPDAVPLGLTRIPVAACLPVDAAGVAVQEEERLLQLDGALSLSAVLGGASAGGEPGAAPDDEDRQVTLADGALEALRALVGSIRRGDGHEAMAEGRSTGGAS